MVVAKAGVVNELLTSPLIAVPPKATEYQRYCPADPSDTESVREDVPHALPPIGEVGAAGVTQKLPVLVTVLPATVTVMVPLVAPTGTVVVMLVAVLAVTTVAVPLN